MGRAEKAAQEAARALGRRGGLKGGPARAKKLSAKRRAEIARAAGLASAKQRDLMARALLDGASVAKEKSTYGTKAKDRTPRRGKR